MPKPRGDSEFRFDLKTRQGYEVSVVAVGNIVGIVVTRANDADLGQGRPSPPDKAVTAYVTRGIVSPGRIEASFGALGRVAVRFHPSGRISMSRPRRGCKGPDRFTSRFGVFVGRVSFIGESRSVAVHAHRVKGRIRSPLRLRCRSRFFHRPVSQTLRPVRDLPSFTPTILSVGRRDALSATELLAVQIGNRTLFLAVAEQSQGSMAKIQYAFATASSRALAFNDALTKSTLRPPAPFKGQGVYGAAPDGTTSWTGSLAVSFPSAPRLLLTGPEFKATLASGF